MPRVGGVVELVAELREGEQPVGRGGSGLHPLILSLVHTHALFLPHHTRALPFRLFGF